MANNIKGLIVEIGGDTSKLGKALESVNSKSRSLSSELGSINKLLKLDPTNTELLAQKQSVLADAIANTEEKLGILREAEKQVQAQFEKGEVSAEQYRALQREVLATESKLKQYKAAAEETVQITKGLSDSADQASEDVKDLGEKTKDAAKASEALGGSAADAAKNGIKALVASATAAIAAIAALAESTREYRTEMGKLDTAYKTSGHSSQTATAAYKELQSVIGETDQAVEAAQQIALLASSTEQVTRWSELAAGVVGRLGDALQPETFYEAANETLKLGEATGAFTQMLEQTGYNVEEFNVGLQACATTEEKQAYMLGIAEKALGSAAKQYKQTNAEVIRANKANDDWNATLAECGEVVEPVVTDVKELGTALLKSAKQPLKDVATYIRGTFLPNLTKVGTWAKQNLPAITATIAGTTAALVAHKIASLAATAATNGATFATLAQMAAQKALNAVMAASPWGLAVTAVTALGAALLAFNATAEVSANQVDALTEEERRLVDSAKETAEAFRDQKATTQETIDGISSQMGYVQALATELQTLADASGAVSEKDQARADFIIKELNSALGTEYEMLGGVIQKYGDLCASIENVIQQKMANLILEASNADYVTALQNEKGAWDALQVSQQAYNEHLSKANRLEQEYADFKSLTDQRILDGYYDFNGELAEADRQRLLQLQADLEAERGLRDQAELDFNQAADNYGNISMTIQQYQAAETAALQGNYEQAVGILQEKGAAFSNYSENVDRETAKALDALKQEAVRAGVYAKLTKENFEKGVKGYTEEMVAEAEAGYKNAQDAFATAYADAQGVGCDLGDGMAAGMQTKRNAVMQSARNLVASAINAMRITAESHSPAKKTIEFGEDMGEGAEIGIDNKTKDVAKAGQRQAEALLDAYRSQEVAGQQALQNVAARQASLQAGSYIAAGAQNADVLNKILVAIEKGQVLTIDRDTLIGGTADGYNAKFGQLRMLADRGAL